MCWICQGIEYTRSSYIFNRLLKIPRVLNKPGFWIWQVCICEGYAEFGICLIMATYASIMPEYASVSLNMAEYWCMSLNMPENAWINCFKYAMVPNMLLYSYDNIIIIATNVIILEFLSARLVNPGALLPVRKFSKLSKLLMNFSFWLQWRQSFRSVYMNS